MGYRMDLKDTDRMFAKLQEEYEIWAPKRFVGKGKYSDIDLVKCARVDRAEEIEYREKSDFPAKEVLSPTAQSLFYFIEDEFIENKADSKKLLISMRPCSIHVQHHQGRIYLTDGGHEDIYYKRMNKKVKIAMMEYGEGQDTRFCASTGTSETDDYSMIVRLGGDGLEFQVKDHAFASYLEGMEECPFESQLVEKNELTLTMSEIPDKEVLTGFKEHPMWGQFDGRCISCGICIVTCSTYTRFTTVDIIYGENRNVGECKKTFASYQVKDLIDMTGDMSFRSRAGDRMRCEAPHKFRDYKTRFKDYHICVGCGRCMDRRSEYIFIVATVNKMADTIEEIKVGKQA